MTTNNNTYQNRYNPMSSSSMFTGTTNNEFKRINTFNQATSIFDPFQKNIDNKIEESNNQAFPRAMASQSMISTNTSASSKRATIGKLDSMARKVVTTLKQQNLPEPIKKPENPFASDDNISQSMISPNSNTSKPFYGLNKMFENKKLSTEPAEPVTKKRRESIDLGFSARAEASNQMLPFMRRAVQNQPKNQKNNQPDSPGNGMQSLKHKNFEFLKKRKDINGSQTSPTIIPTSIQAAQSMKSLQQFYQNSHLKKPEFLSPIPKQSNDIKCPEDRFKQETPTKLDTQTHASHNNSPISPSFQFKKKKIFEAPIQISAYKTPTAKDESNQRQPLTAKERRNARPQRQIKLSDFQLLEKLGKGAFGEVYIAQEKNIGFICVIKKMSKKRIRQMKVQNHILRQIKIQSYLNHPNLTSLFGYFHDEEYLYLVIEALPDGSLQQVKKKRKLPEKEAASIIKQVSIGLKYMHEQFIIHRDLKPQNLFVNDGVIKIGDFGCSIYNQDSGLRTTVVGCLEYSSPEQLSNQGYSQKIDAWSLGILTYELLFGKSPFEKDIINITKNKQAEAKLSELAYPASIPIKDETKDFIQNLLAQNPDKRMDMDQVLVHDFLKEQMGKKQNKLQLI